MFYYIPGFKEDGTKVASELKATLVAVDWTKPLSEAVFDISKNDTVVGFSYGAIVAYLFAKKNNCKAILASMTPIEEYTYLQLYNESLKDMTEDDADKQIKELMSLSININNVRCITVKGEKESLSAQFVVPETGHEINDRYVEVICKLLSIF